jgi:protein-disulfide isomerase
MKTIRFLMIGVFVLAACACSRSGDEAAAPISAPAADSAATPGGSATPAAAPAPAEVASLAPDLAAHLVRFHSPVLGRADAPVTVVEFLDPACEACRMFAPVVKQILFVHPDDVRVVVRYAAFHAGSDEAVRVLDAARRQGKFEETLTGLFDRQEEWASHHAPNPAQAWQIAADSGVDIAKARKDARKPSVDGLLRQEADDRKALKVDRTPTFFVNGKPLPSLSPQQLLDLVDSEVRRAQQPRPLAQ